MGPCGGGIAGFGVGSGSGRFGGFGRFGRFGKNFWGVGIAIILTILFTIGFLVESFGP